MFIFDFLWHEWHVKQNGCPFHATDRFGNEIHVYSKGMDGILLLDMIFLDRCISCPKYASSFHFVSLSSHCFQLHDDAITWKSLVNYWHFVNGICHELIPLTKKLCYFLPGYLKTNCWITSRIINGLTRHHSHVVSFLCRATESHPVCQLRVIRSRFVYKLSWVLY